MATERRTPRERREKERRRSAGESTDVMRLEHENLYNQVEVVVQRLRQLETDLRGYRNRLEAVERNLTSQASRTPKTW